MMLVVGVVVVVGVMPSSATAAAPTKCLADNDTDRSAANSRNRWGGIHPFKWACNSTLGTFFIGAFTIIGEPTVGMDPPVHRVPRMV
jgi:hypothetical protein